MASPATIALRAELGGILDILLPQMRGWKAVVNDTTQLQAATIEFIEAHLEALAAFRNQCEAVISAIENLPPDYPSLPEALVTADMHAELNGHDDDIDAAIDSAIVSSATVIDSGPAVIEDQPGV